MESALRKIQDRVQSKVTMKKTATGSRYFGNAHRGEMMELAQDLQGNDKDKQKKAVKRIIANMTVGRDVSSLFTDVVKLGQTFNVELKKLVYLYVLNTARMQQDKALLSVNTFLQDVTHQSPIIRALALRTMMCIRVDAVVEYTLDPLRRCVVDEDPYVRKTAAFGIGKLFHICPRTFYENGFMEDLLKLLTDKFPLVSSNAAAVLQEINTYGSQPHRLTSDQVTKLINAMPEATEWGQCYILDLLSAASVSVDEARMLVERTIPRLGHTNPCVSTSAIKLIVNLMPQVPDDELARKVASRINSALVTLAKADHETQYITCKNVLMLVPLMPGLLRNNLDSFFVRFSDPLYVKLEKLKLLLQLVDVSNAALVVRELQEYTSEVDIVFVREVVAAFATLALKVDDVSEACAVFLGQLAGRQPELLPHIVSASKNIVRKHPEHLILGQLLRHHAADSLIDEDAKVSLVWMLGEFCDFVEGGPELIQGFLDNLLQQEPAVQLSLLTAVVKIFLRSPERMERALSTTLEYLTQRSRHPDIRDRANFYLRLLTLELGVEKMKRVVHGRTAPVDVDRTFAEGMTITDLRQGLNTAVAIYGRPAKSFVPVYGGTLLGDVDDEDIIDVEEETIVIDEEREEPPTRQDTATPTQTAAPKPHVDPFDDIFAAPKPPPKPTPTAKPATTLDDDELWGVAAKPAPTATGTIASPLPLVYQDSAIAVKGQFNLGQKPPVLSLAITSVAGASPLSAFVMQINKNILGIAMASPLAQVLPSHPVAPGTTVSCDLPLTFSETHFITGDQLKVELGLKASNGLVRFFVPISGRSILAAPPAIDRPAYVSTWKSLGENAESKITADLTGAATAGAALVQQRLTPYLTIVAESSRDGFEVLFAAAKIHTGTSVLVEIQLNIRQPRNSTITCKGVSGGAVAAIGIADLLADLFPSRGHGSVANATASALDDLFA